jgi:Cys-rich protein (TIGR01571 family)
MIEAPTGRWKDGLFACCVEGFCHPSFWCSWCCHTIGFGQVMSRMQLTWLGEPGPISKTRQAFLVVLILTVSYYIYSSALEFAAMPYDIGQEPEIFSYLRLGGTILFTIWSVYALCRTRQSVRTRYQIPEQCCTGCEDLCCSIWCTCCTTAQLMRHTGEYETYPGVCCSVTGHPPGTPLVV